ncbi:tRNA-dihydrouridine(47) synthase [NAD(P)(+)] [Mycena sanguinolenta]|uniref:tRNA-dihydrouridine(47) synthase [NAD(P)(+)] n=1 Tax=Mycena sanguinolenta TaxID=230812 RepID=A0A8H6X2N9_9AGAR|nr:tRNA-dihydrouridine(47) synthase [NAD(P)(+)] [Mycena sanguinolenta]
MLPAGTAQVKAEFLLPVNAAPSSAPDDDAAEGSTSHVRGVGSDSQQDERGSGPARGKLTKAQKKAQTGVNKGRRFGKMRDELDLCYQVAAGGMCDFGEKCRNNHDIAAYLAAKPSDLAFPASEEVKVMPIPAASAMDIDSTPSTDSKVTCPVFEELGECRYGFRCRFLAGHLRHDESGAQELIKDEEKMAFAATNSVEVNRLSNHAQKLLRTKKLWKYPFPIATAYAKEVESADMSNNKPKPKPTPTPGANAMVFSEPDQDMDDVAPAELQSKPQPQPIPEADAAVDAIIEKRTGDAVAAVDAPDVPTRFAEKKRLDWAGKTYLAPLTTVGNLPFRRLCVSYGADITCGEMGLSNSFLSGSKEEWSLVRRHPSEKIFGVQIAGSKALGVASAAEVLAKECGDTIDFVDLNCGCPIDLVFKTGSGSALLDNVNRLGKIVVGMSRALGEIPVTVKLRTGVKDGKNTAHKLMPRLAPEFGAGCITLHGRTRQQRYTKLADWAYIKECVDAVRAREADEDLPRVPIFGGGDCFSSQDYWSCVEQSGVDGVMVARGALIKPWIFTEIKEHREWDISARERLEGIRKYAEFDTSGTDTAGVNATRRYLCEALSFQYRYVPLGILEHLPGRINDRAPAFRGRDDLETLLASGDSRDWVRISEMFLGPAPEMWSFTPKHKSNAYESQG